jgi:hypothetical protein
LALAGFTDCRFLGFQRFHRVPTTLRRMRARTILT